ncbi:Cytochrome P450 monooxygenase patI [Colletotrichum fructicola Nara gc5]|uniref:Cytochrome P450 monooxygenase patI n=1 Tax=Colletotrichum fructicola (strain Nara gc5) TaxID=1213859 RepID=A0A7J6JKW1_COLFN|nr:Cytochrome P450 monooxygenase patI [Colletotrichum fructicola Nara gc5]
MMGVTVAESRVVGMVLNNPTLAILGAVILGLAVWVRRRGKSTARLPPQPPATPVLGHLPELIRENKTRTWHLRLNEWARTYGPIFGVRSGYIVDYYINSDVMVKEIFDKKSAQTADRPTWIMSSTILNNDFNVLFLKASDPTWKLADEWLKNQRKVINQLVTNVQKADEIIPLLEYETLKFLHENVTDANGGLAGARLYQAIGRYTYSAFATAFMGMDIPDTDDAVIPFIMEAETQIINTFPGMNVIDLMPSLGKLPMFLKPWERKGRARYRRDLTWAMKRLEAAQDRLAKGDPSLENTFWGSVLQSDDLRGMSCKEEVAILGLSLIVGAADTSRMTTWTFLEAMMMFPEVQAKAREDIGKSLYLPSYEHRVVGERIPVYDDLKSIPYLRMMMKELWRWRPPVALGHPHITARDLQVGEYCLPKGARLHINAYAISHDPARHEDPERFWPERFKDDETTTMESMNAQDPTKRDHFAFGAGRRGCPGYHVAERSFVITMMRILWAFDIAPAPGTKSTLEFADYAGELPGNPADDMPVKLTYRSESRKKIVMDVFERETAARPAMMPLNMGEKRIPKPEEYL